jgi:NAD(P)-dependent dehydrogenase (short-subunit alcohol dehydrogenase family)
VPLGRFTEAQEVARLALFLASDAGAAMTGQAVNIDGGAAMW